MQLFWYFLLLKFNSFLAASAGSTCERHCHSNKEHKKEQKLVQEYSDVRSPWHWKNSLCQGKTLPRFCQPACCKAFWEFQVLRSLPGLKSTAGVLHKHCVPVSLSGREERAACLLQLWVSAATWIPVLSAGRRAFPSGKGPWQLGFVGITAAATSYPPLLVLCPHLNRSFLLLTVPEQRQGWLHVQRHCQDDFYMDLSQNLIFFFSLFFGACPQDLRFHQLFNSGRFDTVMQVEFFFPSISTLNPFPSSFLWVWHLKISKAT